MWPTCSLEARDLWCTAVFTEANNSETLLGNIEPFQFHFHLRFCADEADYCLFSLHYCKSPGSETSLHCCHPSCFCFFLLLWRVSKGRRLHAAATTVDRERRHGHTAVPTGGVLTSQSQICTNLSIMMRFSALHTLLKKNLDFVPTFVVSHIWKSVTSSSLAGGRTFIYFAFMFFECSPILYLGAHSEGCKLNTIHFWLISIALLNIYFFSYLNGHPLKSTEAQYILTCMKRNMTFTFF